MLRSLVGSEMCIRDRSKYIFAGFTVKWRSLKRPYLRKFGRLAVLVLYVQSARNTLSNGTWIPHNSFRELDEILSESRNRHIFANSKCAKITSLLLWDIILPISREHFLADVNYVTSAICYRPSVCRLSVTLVHPTQAVAIFGNFFPPYDSSGTLVF